MESEQSRGTGIAAGVFLAGAATAVLLGTYGRVHDPTGETALTAFFSGQLQFKVWAATLAVLFAVAQLVSALRMYGRFRTPAPPWLGDIHRLTGTLAFVCTLPVAYHCLWSIGFDTEVGVDRVFVHSVAGCLFYGAFVVKVSAVRIHRIGWVLPAVGGTVFTLLVVLWFTSSFWFFTTFDGALR
ncbi:MAG: hypothetical protein H6518_09715 [Microthrixaceae bacterium]|nr:hypothetical protein [Microthrixaceae bacterium]